MLRPAILALAALTLASPALAQEEGRKAVSLSTTPDADLRTGYGGSGVVVSASSDSGAVAFTVGRKWDGGRSASNEDLARYVHRSWTAKFSAPLDKDTGEGAFLVEGSLAKSTSLELGYSSITPPRDAPGRRELSMARDRALQSGAQACIADKVGPAVTDPARRRELTGECEGMEMSAMIEAGYIPLDQAQSLSNVAFLKGWTRVFNVAAGVGHQSFDFRDSTTLAELSENRTPYSASVSFGVIPPGAWAYLGLGAEYRKEYADAPKRTLCQPPPASGPQECFSGPFGRPVGKEVVDAFGVIRKQSQWGAGPTAVPFGVEFKFARDFENEVTGVGAALYLVPDKEKALRGGLRLLWQTDDNDPDTVDENFAVGIFVSSAFSVF